MVLWLLRRGFGFVCIGLLFAGCVAPPAPVVADSTLFTRGSAAPADRLPGRVALVISPPTRRAVNVVAPTYVIVEIGSIVEQAMSAAMVDDLPFQVQELGQTPAPADGYLAALAVTAAAFTFEQRSIGLPLPNPFPKSWSSQVYAIDLWTDWQCSYRLTTTVAALDASGATAWSRTYEDETGRFVWTQPQWVGEPGAYEKARRIDMPAVVHEVAWRVASRAVQDFRAWLLAERERSSKP